MAAIPQRCPACGKAIGGDSKEVKGACPHCKTPLVLNYWSSAHVQQGKEDDSLGFGTLFFAGVGIALFLALVFAGAR